MDSYDRIDNLLSTLEKELETYDELVVSKTKAEATYKSLRAKEWLRVKGSTDFKTVGDREAFIDSELENEFFDFKLAEGKLDAHKERVRTLRSMLSALQTLAQVGRV